MTDAAGLRCPSCGAVSSDPEFCSDCGAALTASGAAAAAAAVCPVCGEPRPNGTARFCDNCRYDFLTAQPFSAAPPSPPLSDLPPSDLPVSAAPPPARHWDLRALVDPSLRQPNDPAPSDSRERRFPLDLVDHLVGRRSDKDDIHPEIVITDPGISRRHLRLLRAADGALSVLDLGSTNGTKLNGAALEPNVPTPLATGDELALGCWTRLVVVER